MKTVRRHSSNARPILITAICALLFLIALGVRSILPASAADPGLTSQTVEVIPYAAEEYRFATYALGGVPSDYGSATFDDSAFATGDAAFGSGGGCPLQAAVKTDWPVYTEIVVRKGFDLPPGATNLRVMVAIDNDVEVFLNGVEISGGLIQHENCPELDEFRFDAPNSALNVGTNLLSVRGRDRGVESCLDMRVLVEVPPTPTPTNTPVPPTPTPTFTPVPPSPTPTNTPVPPSPTPTFTPIPPTPTRTSTPVPPTATPVLPTATPPPSTGQTGVGGKVLLPPAAIADASGGTSGGSGQTIATWMVLAGVAGVLGVGGLYARSRRRSR
jgi:hypothetical protein